MCLDNEHFTAYENGKELILLEVMHVYQDSSKVFEI